MIKLFGKLFWNIVRTFLPGPSFANRPVLIIVDNSEEIENIIFYSRVRKGKNYITHDEAMKDNPAV